jgi:DNA-binding response OmpR family regulator
MSKILLVEDDSNLREIYGARLEAEGYQIIAASDGEEALAVAVRERPDLIISDVMMPKISGFDMLDILRSTPETKNVKVIVMTALSQDEDRERGEKLGADRYVVKSQVTLDDVVGMVQELLGDTPTGAVSAPADNAVTTTPSPASDTPSQDAQSAAPAVAATPIAVTTSSSQQDPSSTPPAGSPAPEPAQQASTPPDGTTNTSDPDALHKEVEQFVASSPLMNGVPPVPADPAKQPQDATEEAGTDKPNAS